MELVWLGIDKQKRQAQVDTLEEKSFKKFYLHNELQLTKHNQMHYFIWSLEYLYKPSRVVMALPTPNFPAGNWGEEWESDFPSGHTATCFSLGLNRGLQSPTPLLLLLGHTI